MHVIASISMDCCVGRVLDYDLSTGLCEVMKAGNTAVLNIKVYHSNSLCSPFGSTDEVELSDIANS